MNIAILLPYKENFSKNYAGAVSIFVNDTNKLSKFNKSIKVFGSTENKNILKNYINIGLKKNILLSTTNQYLNNFAKLIWLSINCFTIFQSPPAVPVPNLGA